MNLPRPVLIASATLFALSVVATLLCLGLFFWHGTNFWYVYDVDEVVRVDAVVSAGLSGSSGLLFVHFKSQESYLTFEAIVFLIFFGLSLVNLVLAALMLYFG